MKIECEGKRENVKEVIKKTKENSIEPDRWKSLEINRMPVSHFYQKLALINEARVIRQSLIFKVWNEINLKIVDQLLIPWEETIEGYSVKIINGLHKLYEDSKKYEDC